VRRLIRDTTLLYVLYAFKLLSPLLIVPLLAHKLTRDVLGQFAICVSIASTVAVAIELGFGLSATRVATGRRAPYQRKINNAVLSTRLAGAVVALPICLAVTTVILKRHDATVIVIALLIWAAAVCGGLTNFWFFQANDGLPTLAAMELLGIASATGFVLVFARSLPSALIGNLLIQAVPLAVTMAVVSRRLGGIKLSVASAVRGWRLTREMAKFRLMTTSYTSAVPAVLGALLPAAYIAPFYIAERFVRAITAGFIPVTNIAYPKMCALRARSPERHTKVTHLMLYAAAVAGTLAGVIVTLCSTRVAAMLSPAALVPEVARHLGRLVWIMPPLAVSTVLGNLFLLPRGQDRVFNRIILASALCGFCLVWVLPARLGASGAVVAILAAEIVAAIAMLQIYFGARRHDI